MLRILIHNDGTGTNENANYDWVVDVNGIEIAKGRVLGHNRGSGWQVLLEELLQSYQGSPTIQVQRAMEKYFPHHAKCDGCGGLQRKEELNLCKCGKKYCEHCQRRHVFCLKGS